jgi:hypothetical protein
MVLSNASAPWVEALENNNKGVKTRAPDYNFLLMRQEREDFAIFSRKDITCDSEQVTI